MPDPLIAEDAESTTNSPHKTMPPLVSVIIPSYNSARFLAEAVKSAFAQTYTSLECIVVDDGSTDNTDEVLQQLVSCYPSLRTAKKTNGGPSSARNLGLRLCRGDAVSFLDADDVLLPGKIESQVNFLEDHPEVGLVYGDYLIVTENLHAFALFTAEMPRKLHPLDALCYRNWFNPLVPLIRRSVIEAVGEFDEGLPVAEDWDYWIRCAKVTRMSYVSKAVAMYRQHSGQLHRDHAGMRDACIRVIHKHFCQDPIRLRVAMAAIDFKDAKYYWHKRDCCASFLAVMRYALRGRLGISAGRIWQQFKAMTHSQLEPL
jgi:glycosyltransferase involved in cell wall biosynthesis